MSDVTSKQVGAETNDKKKVAKTTLRDHLTGTYLYVRCVVTYFSLFMVMAFAAESLLNTVRLTQTLPAQCAAWMQGGSITGLISGMYPAGTSPVTIISTDLVAIYLFIVVIYSGVRYFYLKTVRESGEEIVIGGLSWDVLKARHQPLLVSLAWLITPRDGVHRKFAFLWVSYCLLLMIAIAVSALAGISVYVSPEFKFTLYGVGLAFFFGLLEETKMFHKIPPKEAIVSTLLALVTGIRKLDYAGTIEKISGIMAETQRSGTGEVVEIMTAVLELLKKKAEEEKNAASMRDPEAT